MNRVFTAAGPNRLWRTQHRTDQGRVFCSDVLEAFSRRVVGWSIADHLRAELVCDALDMARWHMSEPQARVAQTRPTWEHTPLEGVGGVVEAVPDAAHGTEQAGGAQALAEGPGGVIRSGVTRRFRFIS